jgi:protein-L-isoaspartate(D-aspartate) O-methyltransferase
MDLAEQTNQRMVDRLIAEGALWSPALISAFRATPRHRFLDRVFYFQRKRERWREVITREPTPGELRLIYSDRALITRLGAAGGVATGVPISSSSQPSLMAQMLEDLKLQPGLNVLEVGAGTGYNAALIAHVIAPGEVTSLEVDQEVLSEAWDHLRRFPERQVQLRHADGRSGYSDTAPYDRIIVTAATPDLEEAWLEQLGPRGLLLAPLVFGPGLAYLVRGAVSEGVFHGRLTRAAYFMPLRTEGETGPSDVSSLPPSGELQALGAPWAGWFDRRRLFRVHWLGFSHSLAFFALLRGLSIHYRLQEDNQPSFGVSMGDDLCWLGTTEWHVNGESGRDLGWGLWRSFLDAGAPWPTEYRLRASSRGVLEPGRRRSFVRHGARYQQVWEIAEPRDRVAWM